IMFATYSGFAGIFSKAKTQEGAPLREFLGEEKLKLAFQQKSNLKDNEFFAKSRMLTADEGHNILRDPVESIIGNYGANDFDAMPLSMDKNRIKDILIAIKSIDLVGGMNKGITLLDYKTGMDFSKDNNVVVSYDSGKRVVAHKALLKNIADKLGASYTNKNLAEINSVLRAHMDTRINTEGGNGKSASLAHFVTTKEGIVLKPSDMHMGTFEERVLQDRAYVGARLLLADAKNELGSGKKGVGLGNFKEGQINFKKLWAEKLSDRVIAIGSPLDMFTHLSGSKTFFSGTLAPYKDIIKDLTGRDLQSAVEQRTPVYDLKNNRIVMKNYLVDSTGKPLVDGDLSKKTMHVITDKQDFYDKIEKFDNGKNNKVLIPITERDIDRVFAELNSKYKDKKILKIDSSNIKT
ncbi:MAG: hypothetical protein KAJ14_13320, partial [Candidatus Omnitrophica bacterium]|nr:hypothetical protein [Candidatus Omnitrophota bacterium]